MPRALWKGFLKIAELSCPVALHAAATTSERIAFHVVNRKTGHRIRRQFVDEVTGKPVDKDDQIKGHEVEKGEYVELEPEELSALVPHSDKTIDVSAFVECPQVRAAFFDRPYFLTPDGPAAEESYGLIREGLASTGTAAIGRAVLFRRMRTVLIRPFRGGLGASTLSFDHEVRHADDAFAAIPEVRIDPEMLDLAGYIIKTKEGEFDPAAFEDRYEAALRELIAAKAEGRAVRKPAARKQEKVVDLMAALRESARAAGKAGSGSSARSGKKSGGKAAGKSGSASRSAAANGRRKAG